MFRIIRSTSSISRPCGTRWAGHQKIQCSPPLYRPTANQQLRPRALLSMSRVVSQPPTPIAMRRAVLGPFACCVCWDTMFAATFQRSCRVFRQFKFSTSIDLRNQEVMCVEKKEVFKVTSTMWVLKEIKYVSARSNVS